MDEHIVETQTEEFAWDAQGQIHQQMVDDAISEGRTIVYASGVYGVPDGTPGIVGRNLMGIDIPTVVTWFWAIPAPTPEDTWFITDLPEKDIEGQEGTDYARREKPIEWNGVTGGDFNSQFDNTNFDTGAENDN